MLKEIIAVTNDKGGVGKTTTSQNLAVGLTLKGYKVLVIDADSQRYASFSNGWEKSREDEGNRTLFDAMSKPSSLPVYKSGRGVFYTPSSDKMAEIDPFLKSQLSPNQVLPSIFELPIDKHYEEEINSIKDFDYVIIDCPPSLGSVTLNAMSAATGLIIPVQLEGYSIRGLGNITAKFKGVQASLNRNLRIRGFLFVMAAEKLSITKAYSKSLRETFGDLVFNTVIRRNVRIPESQDSSSDIFEYDMKSIGAKDYMAFTEEFLKTSPSNI